MNMRKLQDAIPSPLALALGLSAITFLLVALAGPQPASLGQLADYWYQGVWELLAFAMQMVLILVLGHTLALSPAAQKLIGTLASRPANQSQAVSLTAALAMLMGMLNWGLGLIFGAILARSLAQNLQARNIPLNYPLLAAAGYTGMMVWHGGLSGSAPLKVADSDHFLEASIGRITVDQTLFTGYNLAISGLVIGGTVLALALYSWQNKPEIGARETIQPIPNPADTAPGSPPPVHWLSRLCGGLLLVYAIYRLLLSPSAWSVVDLNFINFILLGLALSLHHNLTQFGEALQEATGGAAGIVVQFPLYAGIMGLVKYSGTLASLASSLIAAASAQSLPYLTFISAGLLNLLVPSGGGQWAVQGPVVTEAALQLGAPVAPVIMALAYGDGLTNMLQPFWALPLLGITRLDAKDIAPYCAYIFLIGFTLYSLGIWLFM